MPPPITGKVGPVGVSAGAETGAESGAEPGAAGAPDAAADVGVASSGAEVDTSLVVAPDEHAASMIPPSSTVDHQRLMTGEGTHERHP